MLGRVCIRDRDRRDFVVRLGFGELSSRADVYISVDLTIDLRHCLGGLLCHKNCNETQDISSGHADRKRLCSK